MEERASKMAYVGGVELHNVPYVMTYFSKEQ